MGLVFAAAVALAYWYRYDRSNKSDRSELCIQVVQKARNPQTGEVKDFPTPCDVPEGWEKIEPDQLNETSSWKIYRSEKHSFELKYPSDARVFGDF